MKFNTLESAVALFTLASLSYAEAADMSVMSVPHDSNIYTRAAIPEDLRRLVTTKARIITSTLVVDAVVNNTDPALKNSDTVGFRGEVSIGIVKGRHEHHKHDGRRGPTIVLTDFEEQWGTTAPLWRSPDGGLMWTKEFTINPPPGDSGAIGCPCDQSVDFNPVNGTLAGTFLTDNIFSAASNNLTVSPGAFNYFQSPPTTAVPTTHLVPGVSPDQPWLLAGRKLKWTPELGPGISEVKV